MVKLLTVASYVIGHPEKFPGIVVWIWQMLAVLGQGHLLPVVLGVQRRKRVVDVHQFLYQPDGSGQYKHQDPSRVPSGERQPWHAPS